MNSCPFVSICGSKPPTAFHPQPLPRCTNSRLFVSIRGSKRPAAKPLQDRSRAGKPDLHKFVSIRVHSWFKTPPLRFTRSDSRAARIRGYSCPFVVQNYNPAFHPQPLPALHEFAVIRVHSWFKTTPCVSPAATAALHAVTSSEVQPDATTDKVLPAVDEGILQ